MESLEERNFDIHENIGGNRGRGNYGNSSKGCHSTWTHHSEHIRKRVGLAVKLSLRGSKPRRDLNSEIAFNGLLLGFKPRV